MDESKLTDLMKYYYESNSFTKKLEVISTKFISSVCSDNIEIYLEITKSSKIDRILFAGSACFYSKVGAEIVAEFIKGKQIDDFLQLDGTFIKEKFGEDIFYRKSLCCLGVFNSIMLFLREIKEVSCDITKTN